MYNNTNFYGSTQGVGRAEFDGVETQLEQIAQKVDQIESDVDIIRGESKPIYGLMYNKTTQAVTRTGSAIGKNTFISIDGSVGVNDFDNEPLFSKMTTVYDNNIPMLGNKFTRVPRIWIKITDTPEYFQKEISEFYFDGAFLSPIHWDFTKNQPLDYYLHGCYKGVDVSGKLRSIPNTYPTTNITIIQGRTLATANGVGYQQLDIHSQFVLTTILEIELGSFNVQNVIMGYSTGQWSATHTVTVAQTGNNNIIVANDVASNYRVGQGVALGTTLGGSQIFYGRSIVSILDHDVNNKRIIVDGAPFNSSVGNILCNVAYKNGACDNLPASISILNSNDGKTPFVYRGVESPYGDCWQFMDGVNINNNQAWVCDNATNYAWNVFANPYKQLSYTNAGSPGYISSVGVDTNNPTAIMPIETSGTFDNWIGDEYFVSNGQKIARSGGFWWSNYKCGTNNLDVNLTSASTFIAVCSRLIRKEI